MELGSGSQVPNSCWWLGQLTHACVGLGSTPTSGPGPCFSTEDIQNAWRHSRSLPQWGRCYDSQWGKTRDAATPHAVPKTELGGLDSVVLRWRVSAQGSAAEGLSGRTAQATFLPAARKDCIKLGQEMGRCRPPAARMVHISSALLGTVPSGGLPSLPAPPLSAPTQRKYQDPHIKPAHSPPVSYPSLESNKLLNF